MARYILSEVVFHIWVRLQEHCQITKHLASLPIPKERFLLAVLYSLLTQAEKRVFSQLKRLISAKVSKKKKKRLKKQNVILGHVNRLILVSPFFVNLSNNSTLQLKAATLSCVVCNY